MPCAMSHVEQDLSTLSPIGRRHSSRTAYRGQIVGPERVLALRLTSYKLSLEHRRVFRHSKDDSLGRLGPGGRVRFASRTSGKRIAFPASVRNTRERVPPCCPRMDGPLTKWEPGQSNLVAVYHTVSGASISLAFSGARAGPKGPKISIRRLTKRQRTGFGRRVRFERVPSL